MYMGRIGRVLKAAGFNLLPIGIDLARRERLGTRKQLTRAMPSGTNRRDVKQRPVR